jgi:thiol-disulfide isomerase/thioredoxin
MLIIALNVNAQTNNRLKIGDHVPDLTLKFGGDKGKISKLSDFKGKAIILDFWATTCAPCVFSIPQTQRLSIKYKNDLEIIPVTSESNNAIKFFANRLKRVKGISLISVVEDISLRNIFPYTFIPHFVWISKDGIVKAITSDTQFTEENIKKFLIGSLPNLPIKDDYSYEKNIDRSAELTQINKEDFKKIINDQSFLVFNTIYRGVMDDGSGGASGGSKKSNYVNFRNMGISQLFAMAFGKGDFLKYFSESKIKVVTIDSSLFFANHGLNGAHIQPDEYQKWARISGHTYNYLLKVTNEQRPMKFEIAKRSIIDAFSWIEARIDTIKDQDVFVLKRLAEGNNGTFATNGSGDFKVERTPFYLQINGAPMDRMVKEIEFNFQGMDGGTPDVINETGYSGNISINLETEMTDPVKVDQQLRKFGLTLEKQKRNKEIIVLTDKRTPEQIKAYYDSTNGKPETR